MSPQLLRARLPQPCHGLANACALHIDCLSGKITYRLISSFHHMAGCSELLGLTCQQPGGQNSYDAASLLRCLSAVALLSDREVMMMQAWTGIPKISLNLINPIS